MPPQLRLHGSLDARQFAAIEPGADFIELDGQPVTVGDGEVEPDIVANRDGRDGKSAILHGVFETGAALAAGRKDGKRLAAEEWITRAALMPRPPGESLLERI